VAEDDAPCRYAVCHYLERIGLTVLEASSGTEALELVRESRGRVDMLITDVKMPGMNGLELADAVASEFPRTNIVFATGEDLHAAYPVVRKPFDPEDLLAVIAEKLLQRLQERVV